MKEIDNPDDCTCEDACFGFGRECACIFVYTGDEGEKGQCFCDCEARGPVGARALRRKLRLSLNSRIGISTRKATILRLAKLLGAMSAPDIAIPVRNAGERLSLKLRDTTLAHVISRSGLVVLEKKRAVAKK